MPASARSGARRLRARQCDRSRRRCIVRAFRRPHGDAAHQSLSSWPRRRAEGLPVRSSSAAQYPGAAQAAPIFEIWVYSPRVEGVHMRMAWGARRVRWSDRREAPHRDLRADEGPERQEHGDRARRRQGRFRSTTAAGHRARGDPARRHRVLPDLHPGAARHHRQRDRRQGRAAGRCRALRRRRSVPGRRRRQGNGDLLRHCERAGRGTPLLARRRVRLRRFGRLRSQEDGHHRAWRLGVRKTPFPRAWHRLAIAGLHAAGIGDMAGDVFGNAMLLSRPFLQARVQPPAHLFRSQPRTRPAVSASAERMFRLSRSSWADYDRRTISKGGGVYPRDAKQIALSPPGARAARAGRGAGEPAGDHPHDPEVAGRSPSGTAASAPT